MNIQRFGLAILFMVLAGCGGPNIDAFERFQETPMANATLSFAAPSTVNGSAGSSSGIQTQSSIDIEFEIEEPQMEQALAELLAQAEAAGFEMEMRTATTSSSFDYVSMNRIGPQLSVLVTAFEDKVAAGVILRQ